MAGCLFDGKSSAYVKSLNEGLFVSMVLSPDGDIVACGSQDNSALLATLVRAGLDDVWVP